MSVCRVVAPSIQIELTAVAPQLATTKIVSGCVAFVTLVPAMPAAPANPTLGRLFHVASTAVNEGFVAVPTGSKLLDVRSHQPLTVVPPVVRTPRSERYQAT